MNQTDYEVYEKENETKLEVQTAVPELGYPITVEYERVRKASPKQLATLSFIKSSFSKILKKATAALKKDMRRFKNRYPNFDMEILNNIKDIIEVHSVIIPVASYHKVIPFSIILCPEINGERLELAFKFDNLGNLLKGPCF